MKTTEETPISPKYALETLRETMRFNLEYATREKEAAKDPVTISFYHGCEYAYKMAIQYIDIELRLTEESPNKKIVNE